MKSDDELREELKRIAPEFPEKSSLGAPEGYFDALPDEIMSRWKEEIPKRRTISTWRKIAAIAAVLTGLVIGGFWLISQTTITQPEEISAVEAYQYIHEHIDEFEGMLEAENVQGDVHRLEIPQEEIEEFLIEELNEDDVEELF